MKTPAFLSFSRTFQRHVLHNISEDDQQDWASVVHISNPHINTLLIDFLPSLTFSTLSCASWNHLLNEYLYPRHCLKDYFVGNSKKDRNKPNILILKAEKQKIHITCLQLQS